MSKKVDPRIEVARDVIKLLREKRIVATTGVYFRAKLQRRLAKNKTVDVQELLSSKQVTKCEVCAKGAMMVAHVMKHDNFNIKAYDGKSVVRTDGWSCIDPLLDTFSEAQLSAIEAAFECFDDNDWGTKYRDNDARLRAIMRRIIKNGGEFSASEQP